MIYFPRRISKRSEIEAKSGFMNNDLEAVTSRIDQVSLLDNSTTYSFVGEGTLSDMITINELRSFPGFKIISEKMPGKLSTLCTS